MGIFLKYFSLKDLGIVDSLFTQFAVRGIWLLVELALWEFCSVIEGLVKYRNIPFNVH